LDLLITIRLTPHYAFNIVNVPFEEPEMLLVIYIRCGHRFFLGLLKRCL